MTFKNNGNWATDFEYSWLYILCKNMVQTNDLGKEICIIGLDEDKNIEIEVSVNLFEKLKATPAFVMNCDNLIRLRTSPKFNILQILCYKIKPFDNKLN